MFAVVSVGNEPFLTTGLITRPALLQPEEGMSVATGRVVGYRVSIDGNGGGETESNQNQNRKTHN